VSRFAVFTSVFLAVAAISLSGCSSRADSPAPVAQEEKLTPERAKAALLDMMRSKTGKDLGWFDGDTPDKMAEMAIEKSDDGWYAWTAAFRINPTKAIYTFTVRPRPGARACIFEYKGSFVQEDGLWHATPPELVQTLLQGG
jgi:hypothetical protein